MPVSYLVNTTPARHCRLMNTIANRRRWPRLVLTLPPDANDALTAMARDHFRDRKREALRLVLEGIAREDDTAKPDGSPQAPVESARTDPPCT